MTRRDLLMAGLLAPAAGTAAPPAREPELRLLVPAYFRPEGDGLREWERLIAAAASVPVVAIANPASGPGRAAREPHARIIERAAAAGVTVIGYVSSRYGRRPRADVEADVDRWAQFYPRIGGIFCDEQSPDAAQVPYYQGLRTFVQARIRRSSTAQPLVVTNPGTRCDEAYWTSGAADTICVFERQGGFDAYRRPAWSVNRTPEQFAALVHGVPTYEEMRRYVVHAVDQGIGYLYVTDDVMPNPWNQLPSYWEGLAHTVRRANTNAKPRPYSGVPVDHPAYDEMQTLAFCGLPTGFPDGTFSGKWRVTRIGFATAIRRMLTARLDEEYRGSPRLRWPRGRPSPLSAPVTEFQRELEQLGLDSKSTRQQLATFEEWWRRKPDEHKVHFRPDSEWGRLIQPSQGTSHR